MSRLEAMWLQLHDEAMTTTRGRDLPACEPTPPPTPVGDGQDHQRLQTPAPNRKAEYQRIYRRRQAVKRAALKPATKSKSQRRVEIRRGVLLAFERGDTAEAQRLAAQLPQSYRDELRYTAVRRGWRWP